MPLYVWFILDTHLVNLVRQSTDVQEGFYFSPCKNILMSLLADSVSRPLLVLPILLSLSNISNLKTCHFVL